MRICSDGVGGDSRSLNSLGRSKWGLGVGTYLLVIREEVNGA